MTIQGPHQHTHTLVFEYDCAAPSKEACTAEELLLDAAIMKAVEAYLNGQADDQVQRTN